MTSAVSFIRRPVFWRVLLFVAMLVLLALSQAPSSPLTSGTGWDKGNHALAFTVLMLLGARAWPGRAVSLFAGLLAYGGLIEVLQSFTVDRFAEWGDLIADAVGLLLGQAIVAWRRRGDSR